MRPAVTAHELRRKRERVKKSILSPHRRLIQPDRLAYSSQARPDLYYCRLLLQKIVDPVCRRQYEADMPAIRSVDGAIGANCGKRAAGRGWRDLPRFTAANEV
jgi:hypothetical protein